MTIEVMVLGGLGTNTYFAIGDDATSAVIVDPAGEADRIKKFIENKKLTLKAILITHGHYDHIGAVPALKAAYNVPVITHKLEEELMADGQKNLSTYFSGQPVEAMADQVVDHKDTLDFGQGLKFQVLIVPGHSPASVCFYSSEDERLFAGDTIFAGSIGRMDFFKGPEGTLIKMIQERLLSLPETTKVYPGHGDSTTILREKQSNPYLR